MIAVVLELHRTLQNFRTILKLQIFFKAGLKSVNNQKTKRKKNLLILNDVICSKQHHQSRKELIVTAFRLL